MAINQTVKHQSIQTPAINQSLLTESDQISSLQEESSLQGAHLGNKLKRPPGQQVGDGCRNKTEMELSRFSGGCHL